MTDFPPENSRRRKRFWSRMFEVSLGGVLRLLIACLVAGLILAALNIDPKRIWFDFFGTLHDAWDRIWSLGQWAVDYLFLGAVLVVPVFLIARLFAAMKK